MEKIRIINMAQVNIADYYFLRTCAELYCRIWQEPPWNETDWTVSGVLDDIRRELSRPGGTGYLAIAYGDPGTQAIVTGFTWGYLVNKKELSKIAGNNKLAGVFSRQQQVFYIDELGVDSKYRGCKIGEQLTSTLINNVRTRGINSIILRTDLQAIPARKLYEKMGFKELLVFDKKYPDRSYWLLDLGS